MSTLKEFVELVVTEALSVGNVNVYVDQDGVLADFDKGIQTASQNAERAREGYMKVLQNFPQFMSITDDELKARLSGAQQDPGMKALKKSWQNYRQLKFAIAGQPGFFLNLPEMPGAREMLARIGEMTGKLPAILTAPIDGNTDRCEQEKRQWMQNHFPGMYGNFICSQDKAAYANANSILIDDRTKYTNKFQAAGGIAILHTDPKDTIQKLENLLRSQGIPA
jgi:5'(3')-deoxyribonucleotidase